MFNNSHKKVKRTLRVVNLILSVLFIVVIVFVTTVNQQHKALAQGTTPFGGLSTYVFYCTCSAGLAITVDDLAQPQGETNPLLYQAGETTLYPFGQIFSEGVWLLGNWTSGGDCEYYVGKGCEQYDVAGTMTIVGTSM